MTRNYGADFIEAFDELLKMETERDALETKIARQKKRVAALSELVGSDDESTPASLVEGITDACRTVLRGAEKPLFPAEIRDRIQKLGFPPQANLLASVHTVVKRLRDSGEAKEVFEPQTGGSVPASYIWARKLSTLDGLEKALRQPRLPSSVAAQRQRLVEQIREFKGKKINNPAVPPDRMGPRKK